MKKLTSGILIVWILFSNTGCTTGRQDDLPDSTAISISLPSTQIYTSQDDAIGNLVWSQTGDEIAFTAIQPFESEDVYVLNIQTREVHFQANDSVVLSWTLDGRILVESSGVLGIIHRDEEEGAIVKIAHGFGGDFSPSGMQIATIQHDQMGSDLTFDAKILILDEQLNTEELIFEENEVISLSSLEWSPNNTYLVFSIILDDPGNPAQLMLLNLETHEILWLTENRFDNDSPTWSPSGQQIAYLQSEGLNETMLIIYQLGGGCRVSISGDQLGSGTFGDLAWSPDGKYLAYEMNDSIYLLDLISALGDKYVQTGTICN
jgi:Tol biopolymer transport system component